VEIFGLCDQMNYFETLGKLQKCIAHFALLRPMGKTTNTKF